MLLSVAAGAFEGIATNTILPAINDDLHDLEYYGLVLSSFMLTTLLGVIGGGRIADQRKPVLAFVSGAIIFSLGLCVTGSADAMLMVAAGRALQGFGAGMQAGLSAYAVRRCYEEHARPKMLALLSTAYVVPGLVGPTIASQVTSLFGWRWVFLGLVPVMPLSTLLATPSLRLTIVGEGEKSGTISERATWLLILFIALALGVSTTPTAWEKAASGALALICGVPAVKAIFLPGTLLLRRGAPATTLFVFLASASYFSMQAVLPFAVRHVHREPILIAGIILSSGTALWTLGTWLQSKLINRYPHATLLGIGSLSVLIGLAGTGAVLTFSSLPVLTAFPAWALVAFGMGLSSSTASLVVMRAAHAGEEGRVASSAQFANLLGGAIGTTVTGAAVSFVTLGGPSVVHTIYLVALFSTCCATLTFVCSQRTSSRSHSLIYKEGE